MPVRNFSILSILLLLTACSLVSAPPTPSPTGKPDSPPPSITPVPTQTPVINDLPSSPTPLPTLTPVPRLPVQVGEHFTLLDWSPDSSSLAFLLQTQQELASSSLVTDTHIAPAGTFHIYNVTNADGCAYPADNQRKLDFNSWHAWLPDGKLAVRTDNGTLISLNKPCDGQVVALTAQEKALVDPTPSAPPGASDSPGSTYRETTEAEPPGYLTTIHSLINGDEILSIPWTFTLSNPGQVLTPTWVTDSHLLIPQSDRGPLWISLDEHDIPQVQSLSQTLFDLPGEAQQIAAGASLPGHSAFHLALKVPGKGTTPPQIEFYHSEDGSVENLPYSAASFTANGQLLQLVSSTNDLWIRKVDPPGNNAKKIMGSNDEQPPGWSSDWQMIAFAQMPSLESPGAIIARSIPDGILRYTWLMSGQYGFYKFDQLLWSPDKRFLAVVGTDANNDFSQALFILSTSDANGSIVP